MKKLLLSLFVFFVFLLQAISQQKIITGKVTISENKLSVIGATVMIKRETIGVITDADGLYSISARGGDTLEFSHDGMKTAEIVVGTSDLYNVELEYEQLDKVVVGYGTQIRSKITSSITKVDGESLKDIPVPGVDQALQGKSAGVFIESVNGKASGTAIMRIRGLSSINANQQPLFVVDGIPITTAAINILGAPINPLTSINLNDIESVEILKDAASSAIYGSRGSNGVVLITTRKGTNGNSKLDFTIRSGFNEASHSRDFMNSSEYISYFRAAAVNGDKQIDLSNGFPVGTSKYLQNYVESSLKTFSGWAAELDGSGNYLGSKVNTDWQDQAFQRGGIFAVDLSASGGNDKMKYYASGSYNKTEGILVSNGMEKFSGRLTIEDKISKHIETGLSLSLNRSKIDQVSADDSYSSPMQLVSLSPVTPVRDNSGNLYDIPVTTYYNALIDVEQSSKSIVEYRSLVNGYLVFNIINGLKLRNELGFDLYNLIENARYGENTDLGKNRNGFGFSNSVESQNINAKSYLDFLRNFGKINSSAILGTEMQYTNVENLYAEGEQYPLDAFKTLAGAGLIINATGTLTRYSFLSYFSRINLDYSAKYLLTLIGRIDGSSRFGKDKRYGFFPAASIGWIVTKENFLADNNIINYLKVRTSYGLTGNSGIPDFGKTGLYGVGSYNSLSGLVPEQIPNPGLGWESTRQFDAGIDFGLFGRRITGELDFYIKKTNGLLLNVPAPETSGYDTLMKNTGSVQNKGIEFVINSANFTGRFSWTSSLNFSFNKNEVLNLGGQTIINPGSNWLMNVAMTGEPIGVFYGAQYAGVDPNNGDALWYINEKDASGHIVNPKATTNDFAAANFVVLGDPTPKYIGAITNTLGFKGIELTFSFQGVAGNKIHLIGDQWMASNGAVFDNQLTSQLRSWKKPGDITDVPEARFAWDNGDQSLSSRYLSNGSYLKLRSLTLSYELPKSMMEKIRLRKMRFFIQGQNLLTFTKYLGWDPEVSTDFINKNIASGCDFYSAPQPRTFILGINICL